MSKKLVLLPRMGQPCFPSLFSSSVHHDQARKVFMVEELTAYHNCVIYNEHKLKGVLTAI
jgi:hypothetical protein